jgi:hypothetical protein
VTTAAFAFINALMFQPSPGVERQEQLAILRLARGCDGKSPCWFPTIEDYTALRDGMSTFSAFTGSATEAVVYNARLEQATVVFPNYFETLGVRLAVGRGLTKDDTDVVVIANSASSAAANRVQGFRRFAHRRRWFLRRSPRQETW